MQIKINYDLKTVQLDETIYEVTPVELDLIELFLKNRGKVLRCNEIIEKVWANTVSNANLYRFMKNIRDKYNLPIKNRKRFGYYLEN